MPGALGETPHPGARPTPLILGGDPQEHDSEAEDQEWKKDDEVRHPTGFDHKETLLDDTPRPPELITMAGDPVLRSLPDASARATLVAAAVNADCGYWIDSTSRALMKPSSSSFELG